ncbi:sigma-70 family RNA polymerase sigma factor [Duganella sp. BJB488]|uniref:RNA polymerase sigma factor n=1 Tax=unclassified Duganella TaxID=2636909 RepID=UPI000E34E601|nr:MULTISPECIES: sigma-70 family RNA polymerase sigma factor [unclassified Duganella]NVD69622.1 sigma-70 family RNA polymerase sigma factor [Duganella sp. BJB1802]RFP10360.1 sigma-70 family RNA polymerase sigma factor [Duganella sp. BJB489]RFP18048.1 sigma-70 family RNA polymerase sigma factor [Duganella sp. BJB488]RFP37803.1 sigma-70 family RNA polymerase sigma factor [Duganella sp. BJB480]
MQQERGRNGGPNPEAEEVRLVARIAAGDKLAFEALYRIYFPRLSRFIGRMARNAALIEEVVNDTMLVVWQKAATFDGTCKVSTWVFAIAYRKTLKGLKASDEPVESDASLYEDDSGNQPEQTMKRQQLQQSVAEALDQLPAAQRAVMVLTYYHDMAYSDIAEVVECPLNTVKTRMFHARHRLKDLLWNERESSQ